MSKFIIWLNWTFLIYLIPALIIDFFEINAIIHKELFLHLDSAISLAGYLLTTINKRKIEFDSKGVIIGDNLKQ